MILCDFCLAPASRMVTRGDPSGRRVFCDAHERTAASGVHGSEANDWIRECTLSEAIRAMRKQNVSRGLLSPQRYAALCRWSPG